MDDFNRVYEREFNIIWHICISYMNNASEAEDALQETFLRYMKFCGRKKNAFHSEDEQVRKKKIRAWLIKTAGNVCKDQLKGWWRKRETYDEELHSNAVVAYECDNMLEIIKKLPDRYKIPVYMYYYMGYNSTEIADVLNMSHSAVRSNLSRARKKLKYELGECDIIGKGGLNNEC